MRLFTRILLVTGLLLVAAAQLYGQGSTTSALSGRVLDANGAPLAGATVTALHEPTGTLAGAYTNDAGRFTLLNLRVGGPFTVSVSFLGFETYVQKNVQLTLGQTLELSVTLQEEGVSIDEVVVTGEGDAIFDGKRTGAETNISREQLNNTPTINRSLADFARLTPQARVGTDGSIQIAGQNNRYNNISIDGAVSNDVFGLAAAGTPGGQTNSRNGTQTAGQISVDALEEIQVVIAPYDVRQGGFTGGGINAVTRSGTNEFEGSVYYFWKNKGLTGELAIDRPTGFPDESFSFGNDFSYYQGGFRLGGPIVKDKLFFFLSTELTRSDEPRILLPGDPARDAFDDAASDSTLSAINTYLVNRLGYPNDNFFGPYTNEFFNDKVLLKLDWNISATHRLSLRHNYVRSRKIEAPSNSAFNFTDNGGGQDFTSIYNSTVAELTSTWRRSSNKLRLVYQTTADDRDPNMPAFPNIRVDNVDGSADLFIGNEQFSMVNKLDQLNIALTNDFSLYRGNHTITVGMHHEYFRFDNRFIRNAYGSYRLSFTQLRNAIAGDSVFRVSPSDYAVSYVNPALNLPDDWGPEFDAFQLGFYVQDEWAVRPNLNVTIGLRADIPFVSADPAANAAFNSDPLFEQYDVATQQVPDTRILLAPRVGFNWDVFADKTLTVRGGFGLFTGRIPFVWISNQFGNTGVELVRFENVPSSGTVPFRYVPGAPRLGALTIDEFNAENGTSLSPNISEINVTSKDFRYPQVFRVNLGADYKLPLGIVATVDLIFGRTINNIHYEDLNRTLRGDSLQLAPGKTGGDTRPLYSGRLSPNYTNVILLTNTNRGYSFNSTLQLSKNLDNKLFVTAAYTYGRATSVNDGTSSQAISNWRFTPNVTGLNNLNSVESTTSNYQTDHRLVASASYTFNWLEYFRTTVTLFYRGESGDRFSYIYQNDINGEDDSFRANDLIYIPRSLDEINLVNTTYTDPATGNTILITAAEQWALLNAYIESDPYLRENRGKYMERNGARAPWNHQLDLSIRQDILVNVGNREHTVQLTMDLFNVLNFLNKEWGRQNFVGFNTVELINNTSPSSGPFTPTYTFTPLDVPDFNEPYSTSTGQSIWQIQFGLRYSF